MSGFDVALRENIEKRLRNGKGKPAVNAIYAVEVFHGWRLLEWRDGQWWHPEFVCKWTGPVEQWVGPLPERKLGKPKPAKVEYDL